MSSMTLTADTRAERTSAAVRAPRRRGRRGGGNSLFHAVEFIWFLQINLEEPGPPDFRSEGKAGCPTPLFSSGPSKSEYHLLSIRAVD